MCLLSIESIGDSISADLLAQIQREEIGHVGAGVTWFKYVIDRRNQAKRLTVANGNKEMGSQGESGDERKDSYDVAQVFRTVVRRFLWGSIRAPFAHEERALAGMAQDWYVPLAVNLSTSTSLASSTTATHSTTNHSIPPTASASTTSSGPSETSPTTTTSTTTTPQSNTTPPASTFTT